MLTIEMDPPEGPGLHEPQPSDASLSEVLASAFASTGGAAHVTLNGVHFALAYRYDAAEISSAVVALLEQLLARPAGEYEANLATSSFPLVLRAVWTQGQVKVRMRAAFSREVAEQLKGREEFAMSRVRFMLAWQPLLRLWSRRLAEMGYRSADSLEIVALESVLTKLKDLERE